MNRKGECILSVLLRDAQAQGPAVFADAGLPEALFLSKETEPIDG